MMKRLILLLMVLFLIVTACSSETASEVTSEAVASDSTGGNEVAVSAPSTEDAGSGEVVAQSGPVRLNEDYKDALPVMSQLAVGTLQLEETDLAVDEVLAAEILPLWQAVQSLSTSDTAASIEIEAVVNQIQDTMQPAQIAAIADMNLTADSLAGLLESGAITFGRGFGQGQGSNAASDGGANPPAGFVPGQGGGPGGGGPGGGGFGGATGGTLSEDDIATRQAQFASGDGLGAVQDQAFVGAVIRLLQNKTGEVPENPMATIANVVFTAVSDATGIPVEEIQVQLGEGTTLVALIEANGGEVTAVRESIIAGLSALPNAADLDVEQLADSWLGQ